MTFDGATSWTSLRYITIPMLGPTIRIWAFLAIIGSIQLFDLVWIMTLGGPAGASSTMATYMVDQGINHWTLPLGAANYSTEHSADTAGVLAFTTLSIIPALVFFLFAERRIVGGLSGAVKG